MGRQAQLEILQGAVKRTLLWRFHNCPSPIFYTFRAENCSNGASYTGAPADSATTRSLHSSESPLNPANPSSGSSTSNFASRNYFHSPTSNRSYLFQNDALPSRPFESAIPGSVVNEGVISEIGCNSESALFSSLADSTRISSRFRKLLRSPSSTTPLVTSVGSISLAALGSKFSLPSHHPGRVGELLSRGFGSLAPSVNHSGDREDGESLKAHERRGGKRGQQGKDEGGLGAKASSSGGVAEAETAKKRRKRSSAIQDGESEEKRRIAAAADGTVQVTSPQLQGRELKVGEGAPATENEVQKAAQTQKKKKSTAWRNVLRAFGDDNVPTSQSMKEERMISSGGQEEGAQLATEDKPLTLNFSNSRSQGLGEGSQSTATSRNENHVASEDVLASGGQMYEQAGQVHDQAGQVHVKKEGKGGNSAVPHFTDQFNKEQVLRGENLRSSSANPLEMGTNVSIIWTSREGDGVTPELEGRATQPPSAKDSTEGTEDASGTGVGREDDNASEFSNPKALFAALLECKGGKAFRSNEKASLNSIFYRFAVSGWVSDQALSLYINSKFFPSAVSKFRRFFTHKSSPDLRSLLLSKGNNEETVQMLFPLFAEFCVHHFPDEINRYRELVHTADMTRPHGWYPFARAIKRKIVYHKGPTNSGKTYNALQRFMASSRGIYCSPLRLLAMEVFDTVNIQGVYCNLHTGQEKRDVPFANHVSCTIEMCYLNQQWDVAVIDEIQMMSDEYRGWAWTRAFLGLQADEIHICGDPSALQLIRNLCNQTGDELVENEYERFKPLQVASEALRGDFRNVEEGDCIVAFSRRDIFDIKREVELTSKHRCCVVYGALPPETRTHQAKLFNQPNNEYSVLVASDAIGMGLNLNIRRVVFFSLDKFDGASKKPVPPAQVKQIAGRAGRRGSLYPQGMTTTFFSQDLNYLKSSMLQDFHPASASGLFPVFEQVELFASQLPKENFAKLLERFAETCRLDGAFFLCRYDNLKRVANMLERVKGLSLEDRFNFCFAPVNVRDPQSMGALYRYATAFSQKIPVQVEMGVPSTSARDEFELLDLESRHQALSMYLWLSQHFPGDLFPQRAQAGEMASQIATLLGQSLVQSSRRWSKRKFPNQYHYRGQSSLNAGPSVSKQEADRKDHENNLGKELVRA